MSNVRPDFVTALFFLCVIKEECESAAPWHQKRIMIGSTVRQPAKTLEQPAWKFLPEKSKGQKTLGVSWGQEISETETYDSKEVKKEGKWRQ